MIVIDTTVLVYATGADHPLREPCRSLIEAISDGVVEATTTTEVIQEFAHIRARRRGRVGRGRPGSGVHRPAQPPAAGPDELVDGLQVFRAGRRLGAFDAVLAAAARSVGASALVSADRAFAAVHDPKHVVPDEKGIARLVE